MGVSSNRSRVADLAFQVFGRALHPEWFTVRGHRRIEREGWEADLRIVEGGHAVLWRTGHTALTEVLTGPETTLPEPGLLIHSAVRRERSAALKPADGVEYQMCFEVERVDPEVFRHLCDELILDPTRGDLFHRFVAKDRLSPAPISRIHAEARGSSLSIQAFHTFPDELAIVRCQSLFELQSDRLR